MDSQLSGRVNTAATAFHSIYWVSAYFFWLFFTQANHPTWTLRIVCTLLLVGASATFACLLVPRKIDGRQIAKGIFWLVILGVITALVIHIIYDALLGPDPRRFSVASNILMDTAFVLVNTAIAGLVAWSMSLMTGRNVWRLWNKSLEERHCNE